MPSGNKRVPRQAVRLRFLGVVTVTSFVDFFVSNSHFGLGKVFPCMHELVQQREPEIVEPVVTDREADDWSAVLVLHGSPVELGLRVMRKNHQRDSLFGEELLRKARTCFRPAKPRYIGKKLVI